MSINSIASASTQNAASQALKQPETNEVGADHDGDADDTGMKLSTGAQSAPTPTVNALGQLVGATINTKA